jgi:hypothetical protein
VPLFATLIKALFTGLIGILTTWVSKRVAIALAVAAVFVAITGTMIATLSAVASGLVVPMPSWLAKPACWFLPDNFGECVSAMLAGQATRFAYDVHVKQLQLKFGF